MRAAAVLHGVMGNVPEFYSNTLESIERVLGQVKTGKVSVVGRSAGGRPIHLVTYGEFEPLPLQAHYSFIATYGRDPRRRHHRRDEPRRKPAMAVIGPVHGSEIEGIAAVLNLISVLETGCDRKGTPWPELRATAEKGRLAIIPSANPDGRARTPVESHVGRPIDDISRESQGELRDGTPVERPSFVQHPVPKDKVSHLGGYYNDGGYDIYGDRFIGEPFTPEARAILSVVEKELPDLTLLLHSCGGGPFALTGDSSLPSFINKRMIHIAGKIVWELTRRGLRPMPHLTSEAPDFGMPIGSALHYASGTTPITFEFGHGSRQKPFTHEEIVEIGLALFHVCLHCTMEERL